MGSDWDQVSLHIKTCINEQQSLLLQFPADAASVITRGIVLSLTADCECKKLIKETKTIPSAAVNDRSSTRNAPGSETNSKSAIHGVAKLTHEYPKISAPSQSIEMMSKRFSVALNTDQEIKWVMQALNYGLTMPTEYWNIVKHCVHIYCDWLGCLLPRSGEYATTESGEHANIPQAIMNDPVTYACDILFSLTRFFVPRGADYFSTSNTDGTDIFNLINESPREPPDVTCVGSIEEITRGYVSSNMQTSTGQSVNFNSQECWVLYLQLATLIVRRVEYVLYNSNLLTTPIWDCLLEFSLAINHAILSIPADIPSLPPLVQPVLNESSSSTAVSLTFSQQQPWIRGMLQLDCLVLTMLTRIWLRALTEHYPQLAYWQGLTQLNRSARHRIALVYQWSRQIVAFTVNLLKPHLASLSTPSSKALPIEISSGWTSNQMSAFWPLSNQMSLADVSPDRLNEGWFRVLHLFGNPVDLCHPDVITHTAVIEQYRRLLNSPRSRLMAAFLPTIFHQALRGLSTVVDLFLGINPSLAALLPTFVGVPAHLYGPVDVTEHFGYASIRTPDVIFTSSSSQQKLKSSSVSNGSGQQIAVTAPENAALNASGGENDRRQSLADILRVPGGAYGGGTGASLPIIDAQELTSAWLHPDCIVTVFYNRPEAVSFLRLVGPWLFEAAISGTSASPEGKMISERSLKVDAVSFHVGRAEAVTCLCRIFVYAKRSIPIPFQLLTRFYVCVIRALALDSTLEYVLSSVLFQTPDLLRADLDAVNVLVPSVFNACRFVLSKISVLRPDYVPMALLRRSAINQLLSMVCIPLHFEDLHFQDITPYIVSDESRFTTRTLRLQLSALLCELLDNETDVHNLRMLMGASFALLQDLIAFELSIIEKSKKIPSAAGDVANEIETASGFFNVLLEKVYGNLVRRWKNETPLASFALEILAGMALADVPQRNVEKCKDCVRSICAFIEGQCKREKKDHTRHLHSVIVHAFQCLTSWLVWHPYLILTDPKVLRIVIETIRIGIFGIAEPKMSSKDTNQSITKPMMPSKRVNEASEHLLIVLFSSVGTFPEASGPDSLSSRLTEDQLVSINHQSNSCQDKTGGFRYFWFSPERLISLLEEKANNSSSLTNCMVESPAVLSVLRDTLGLHVWSWKPRFVPLCSTEQQTEEEKKDKKRKNGQPIAFLETLVSKKSPIKLYSPQHTESPFLPRTIENVPLVQADKMMPTLKSVSAPSSVIRREVDQLKSLINNEAEFSANLGRRYKEKRQRTAFPNPAMVCKPQKITTNLPSAHTLLSHTGFVPVNTLQLMDSRQLPIAAQSTFPSSVCYPRQSGTSTVLGQPTSLSGSSTGGVYPGTKGYIDGSDEGCLLRSKLVSLHPDKEGFKERLDSFDASPMRTNSTLLVFYVFEGQTTLQEVIDNMIRWSELPPAFISFMHSLGWPVECASHVGWAGNVDRGSRNGNNTRQGPISNGRVSRFELKEAKPEVSSEGSRKIRLPPDGMDYIFYWSDIATEVASLCPSNRTTFYSNQPAGTSTSRLASTRQDEIEKVAVIWLESWEDGLWQSSESNPLQSGIASRFACDVLIFLHPLTNGLYRVGIVRPIKSHVFEAGPLVSGLVLSEPCLGNLVRATLINIARRRHLDASDSFQPPYIRRFHTLNDLANSSSKTPRLPFVSAVDLLQWSAERCF